MHIKIINHILSKFERHEMAGNVCISYPKSGRTWVKYALRLGGAEIMFNHGGYATRDIKQMGYLFEGIRKKNFGIRNIFLHRNPLDTSVSEYHQIFNRIFTPSHPRFTEMQKRLQEKNKLPPEKIDNFVLDPIWGCEKVCAFNRAHIDYFKDRDDSKIISYEFLRDNPREGFKTLFDFLGISNVDIEEVVNGSDFSKMREIELIGDEKSRKSNALYGLKDNNVNTLKTRKGIVRGYLDELDRVTVEKAEKICLTYGFDI